MREENLYKVSNSPKLPNFNLAGLVWAKPFLRLSRPGFGDPLWLLPGFSVLCFDLCGGNPLTTSSFNVHNQDKPKWEFNSNKLVLTKKSLKKENERGLWHLKAVVQWFEEWGPTMLRSISLFPTQITIRVRWVADF